MRNDTQLQIGENSRKLTSLLKNKYTEYVRHCKLLDAGMTLVKEYINEFDEQTGKIANQQNSGLEITTNRNSATIKIYDKDLSFTKHDDDIVITEHQRQIDVIKDVDGVLVNEAKQKLNRVLLDDYFRLAFRDILESHT